MTWLRSQRPSSAQLAAYLEGEVSASEAMVLEAELASSIEARVRLSQLADLRARLSTVDPEIDAIDLTSQIRRSLSDARSEVDRSKTPIRASWIVAAAACALALVLAREAVPDFRVKSAASAGSERPQAAISVYRVNVRGEPEPVAATVSHGDGLMFSVVNSGPRPFTHLMVFGVDSAGQIRWFHPAYTVAGTDPSSIAIEPRQSPTLLADIIEHDLATGPMTIYALFTHAPYHVLDVESQFAARPGLVPAGAAGFAKLEALQLTVVP